MRRLARLIGFAAVAAGLAMVAQAAVAPGKAWLGQVLLVRAWDQRLATGQPARPWGWADFAPMARVHVPRLDFSAVVLDQSSGPAMAWGPGHVPGTALPGQPGVAAFAGHRDTHLAFVADLKPGDRVEVETGTDTFGYTVDRAIVVDSRTWRFPPPADGAPVLALATCWPLGAQTPGPMRLVIFADQDGDRPIDQIGYADAQNALNK